MAEKQLKKRFAPKVYGRGLVPISREGWVVVFLMILAIVLSGPLILGGDEPSNLRVFLFIVYIFFVVVGPFLFLMKSRSEGTLKRRRGVKDVDWE